MIVLFCCLLEEGNSLFSLSKEGKDDCFVLFVVLKDSKGCSSSFWRAFYIFSEKFCDNQ